MMKGLFDGRSTSVRRDLESRNVLPNMREMFIDQKSHQYILDIAVVEQYPIRSYKRCMAYKCGQLSRRFDLCFCVKHRL